MVEMQGLVFLLVVASAAAMSLPDKSSPCHRVECRAGRECVVSGGVAQCLCVTQCPDHDIPVCGSDGRSYDNYCRLHQRACLSGTHISVDYKGYCKKDIELAMKAFGVTEKSSTTTTTTTTTTPQPEEELSVCYAPQRDALRNAVIQQWQRSVKKQPWYTEGMTYREALSGHFFACDKNRDYKLRPDELMDCFAQIPFVPRPEQDLTITRTLCVDAMIEDADKNSDWRLDFQEFTHLLDPLYHPQAKKCSLEGKDYTDGAEVHVECNHCVCATGSWVCATHDCPEPRAQTGNTINGGDTFGYLDTKYDLDDTAAEKEKKKKESELLDDSDDDYSDEDYDSDESSDDLKKEDAKKEFMSLSLADQKKVKHLESNIKQFYDDMKKFNKSKNDSAKKTKAVLNTVTEASTDIDEYSDETISEEEEDEEDDLLDEYDDLLEKSKKIREKLTSLRDSIHDLEDRQTDRHREAMDNDSHPNSVSANVVSRTTSAPVSKKQRQYDEFLRNKLERHRQAAQTDNDIWEDQWKAKIKKHQHASIGNHL